MKNKRLQIVIIALMMLATFLSGNSNSNVIHIGASDFSFTPPNVNVLVGDTIQWTRINGSHTTTCNGTQFTSRPAGAAPWNALLDGGNLTFRYVITVAGTYDYICVPHAPSMAGTITATPSSINQLTELALNYELSQNYPNPFNPTTKIKFSIPNSSQVSLIIFNSIGKEVSNLVNERLNSGTYEVDWNAADFTNGVYYYRINAGEFTETKKMLMIK